jgi:hypothetical protein
LAKYGAEEILQREYGQYVVPAEVGYDFSVLIDLENLPESKGRLIQSQLIVTMSPDQEAHFRV